MADRRLTAKYIRLTQVEREIVRRQPVTKYKGVSELI